MPNPSSDWGWDGVSAALLGRVTYQTAPGSCTQGGNQYSYDVYSNWSYVRPDGYVVKFNLTLSDESTKTQCTGGPAYSGTATTMDGSGFTISATAQPSATVYSRSGDAITAPMNSGSSSGSIIDSNGNEITVTSAGNTVFTDTLGTSALTATGSGTPASPIQLTYTSAAGSQATVTVNYASYTVQTNFGCAGINEYAAAPQNLVSSIVLPDGTSYSFNYEPTPGYPGSVTGRLDSVMLPTGGTISYAYTGGNNGITCADGSAATLTRTSPDGTWTYAHSEGGTAWTTVVTDPQSNQTTYNFQQVSGTASAYETERQIGGLETVYTCYNGATEPCNNAAVSLPITQRTEWKAIGGLTSEVNTLYSAYGLPTEIDEYNYGPTLVRKTLITYASLGNYISDRAATITIQNASGATVRATSNSYGNTVAGTSGTPQHVAVSGDRGNLLSTTTGGLSESFTYFDTGKIQTVTDPAGNQVNYIYGNCGNAFVTTINLPMSLSRAESWNCNGGVIASRTDENGKTTTYSYDSMNRLTQISYPDGGSKTIQYPSPTQQNIFTALKSSTSREDTLDLDWLGRVTRMVLASDPEGADFTDFGYDYLGLVHSISNPYRSTSDPTYGSDVYARDALGRVVSITHSDGNVISFSYGNASPACGTAGYATTRTDEAGHLRRTFRDALGRVVEIDEPDPANGNTLTLDTCYTYDALDNVTQIVRGVQTRTFQYDSLSRLTSMTLPESGTTTFSYTGSRGALCAGDMRAVCSRTDANGVTTTYTFDALSRLISKTYSDTTPTAYYYYDEPSVTVGKTVYTLSNTKGRLSHTSTGHSATMTIHSYDVMGRVVAYWQCAVGCGAMRSSQYTYDLAGDETSYVNPSGSSITQTFNGAQRISGIWSSFKSGTIATISYTPFGAASVLSGSAPDWCPHSPCAPPVQTFDYNNRLQLVREQFGSPGQANSLSCIVNNYYSDQPTPGGCEIPPQGAGNNGELRSDYDNDESTADPWRILDPSSHTDTYTYDSLGRVTGTVGAPFDSGVYYENLTYAYDAYGNMACVENQYTAGTCTQVTYDPATNRATLVGTATPTYDADGNLTGDGTGNTYTYDAEGRLTKAGANLYTTYAYNALGQLVEQDESQWSQYDFEILYDPFGRRVDEYDHGERGYGVWGREYVPYDANLGSLCDYTDLCMDFRNRLGSLRWGSSDGDSVGSEALYQPYGVIWYQCDESSFADFDPYCYCYVPAAVGPDGRPYIPGWGRWMTPRRYGAFDPDNLNAYEYGGNDPIDNVDSGDNPPNKPPLPGQDQEQNTDNRNLSKDRQQQSTSCGTALAATGIGLATTVGFAALTWYTAGEALPALDEGLSFLHLASGYGKVMIGPLGVLGAGVSQLGSCFQSTP